MPSAIRYLAIAMALIAAACGRSREVAGFALGASRTEVLDQAHERGFEVVCNNRGAEMAIADALERTDLTGALLDANHPALDDDLCGLSRAGEELILILRGDVLFGVGVRRGSTVRWDSLTAG